MGLDAPNRANAAKSIIHHHHDPAVAQERTVPAAATQDRVPESHTNGVKGVGREHDVIETPNGTDLLVGPLLNYRRMSNQDGEAPVWHGSVLIVTAPGSPQTTLRLRMVKPEGAASPATSDISSEVRGEKLYEEPKGAFWAFPITAPYQAEESQWEYSFQSQFNKANSKRDPNEPRRFWIPARTESMRIMFHSCNGFSVGTDVEAWSGPALWNDVLRVHAKRPIHVMIGGGDQIYNDGIRVDGPLRPWADVRSPIKRRDFPFNEKLRAECDKYYFDNYIRWYGTDAFAEANCQIPQVNIWDDHDIIDGFGSYTDHFMHCPVFRGIGGVAHKYYMLFQHHLPPPKSTFTTDAPATEKAGPDMTTGSDAVQLKDAWVRIPTETDPCYIVGKRPGPYVEEKSHSLYCQLGAEIALVGIDARTERTRHQVNYEQTYDLIFSRLDRELSQSQGRIKHLIVLLGIPVAYPRLAWLENILRSPIIGPIRFLNKRFGFAGNFFNTFDGSVDLLDDLDDHYTTHAHKHERRTLILRLQDLARKHSARVTILGGDVHLAALGRFFASSATPPERDPRYMVNVVSSAITNHPPPLAVANLLARRNKIHHLDHATDETLLELWDRDPGEKQLTAKENHATMPSRNYALITASRRRHGAKEATGFKRSENPRGPLHGGEEGCGSAHPAADEELAPSGLGGEDGLDVIFRVEIDHGDRTGKTRSYGLTIPGLKT